MGKVTLTHATPALRVFDFLIYATLLKFSLDIPENIFRDSRELLYNVSFQSRWVHENP